MKTKAKVAGVFRIQGEKETALGRRGIQDDAEARGY